MGTWLSCAVLSSPLWSCESVSVGFSSYTSEEANGGRVFFLLGPW